jgi:hypothetical protein
VASTSGCSATSRSSATAPLGATAASLLGGQDLKVAVIERRAGCPTTFLTIIGEFAAVVRPDRYVYRVTRDRSALRRQLTRLDSTLRAGPTDGFHRARTSL